jgi:predicted secreted protein
MKRSGKILVVCHCLLNSNAKVHPLAKVGGAHTNVLKHYIEAGVGLLQLPCPELSYLGANRWGMTREQYDHPNFRSHCESILTPTVNQMEAFVQAGYEIMGIMGMDGSPNCGVNRTCLGYMGGEIAHLGGLAGQSSTLRMAPGAGVFMEVFRTVLEKRGLKIPFQAVDEENPANGV